MLIFRKPPQGIDRPRMPADVVIVGGGPAGMACALRLSQLIDQHNAARLWCDLALDVGQFRLPSILFIQIVGVEANPELAQDRRIEWIVRAGREDVLARVDQCREAEIDCLAHARRDEHILHVGNAFTRHMRAAITYATFCRATAALFLPSSTCTR